jgi:hypothetical protein
MIIFKNLPSQLNYLYFTTCFAKLKKLKINLGSKKNLMDSKGFILFIILYIVKNNVQQANMRNLFILVFIQDQTETK